MKIEDIKNEIKLLAATFKEILKPEKFMDYTLPDGTMLRINGEMVVGTAIMVIDKEGKEVPLADGEYEIEMDGMKWKVVVASGLIADAKKEETAPTEEPKKTEEMANEQLKAIMDRLDKLEASNNGNKFEEINKSIIESNATIAQLMSKNEALEKENKKLADTISQTFSLVEKIANSTGEPTNPPAGKKKSEEDLDKQMMEFRKTQGLI